MRSEREVAHIITNHTVTFLTSNVIIRQSGGIPLLCRRTVRSGWLWEFSTSNSISLVIRVKVDRFELHDAASYPCVVTGVSSLHSFIVLVLLVESCAVKRWSVLRCWGSLKRAHFAHSNWNTIYSHVKSLEMVGGCLCNELRHGSAKTLDYGQNWFNEQSCGWFGKSFKWMKEEALSESVCWSMWHCLVLLKFLRRVVGGTIEHHLLSTVSYVTPELYSKLGGCR